MSLAGLLCSNWPTKDVKFLVFNEQKAEATYTRVLHCTAEESLYV